MIQHVAALGRAASKNDPKAYCKYLAVTINGIPGNALCDSGNIYKSAISKDYFLSLGGKLSSLRKSGARHIGTAKAGAFLEILG